MSTDLNHERVEYRRALRDLRLDHANEILLHYVRDMYR